MIRPLDAERCPNCGAGWAPPGLDNDPTSIATLLNAIEGWRADGLIDNTSAGRLRNHYVSRRVELLAPDESPTSTAARPVVATSTAARPVVATSTAARPSVAAWPGARAGVAVRRSRQVPATGVGEWAARRQADVLLYVGAFLLVISALIFMSSQDEAFFGGWRVVVLAVYTGGFLLAGWLLRRWPRVREAGPVFLAIGALMTPLNFLLLHNEVLSDRDVPGELVWLLASTYSTVFYGFLFARGLGRLYIVPAGIALLSVWGSLAVTVELPLAWGGAWWMGFALAATLLLAATRRRSIVAFAPVATIALLALLFAHLVAYFDDASGERWQLPVTHALLLGAVVVAGVSMSRAIALLPAAVLVTTTACTALWAAGVAEQWYSFPPLVVGAVLLAGRTRWAAWSPWLAPGSLLLAAVGGLTPFVWMPAHLDGNSWIAALAFLAAGALFADTAWRNATSGILTWGLAGRAPTDRVWPTDLLERTAFGWIAFGSAMIAVGFAQRGLGVAPPDTGWAFAAIGVIVSVALVAATRRAPVLLWPILPPLLLATGLSVHPVDAFEGHHAVLLMLAAAHVLAAFAVLRRWSLAVVATALAMLAMAATSEARALPWWNLAAGYTQLSIPMFLVLTRLRRYDRPEPAEAETFTAVHALSWLPLVAAVITAAAALNARVEGTGIEAVTTIEYRVLVLVVLLVAPLIAFEAWRMRRWEPGVAALAVLLGGVGALWPVFGWPVWTLAATYSVAGAGVFAALTRWRRPGTAGPEVSVQAIAWSGLILGPLTAMWALGVRLEGLGAEAATLVEFRVSALLFLPLAGAVAFEGYRLNVRWALLPASALVMVALELAIATLEPGNVQAYTVPAALYLALVGLITRTSDELHRNIGWHELLQLGGAALLVIPQAEQGFEPGGARWGLVLLIEGIALLGVAFVLNARWLAVSAVVTLSAVALRFLWANRESGAVPYWVMLAAAGFFLVAVGFTVLLQREWWDRNLARLQRRWRGDALLDAYAPGEAPSAALLTALAPVIAILVVTGVD